MLPPGVRWGNSLLTSPPDDMVDGIVVGFPSTSVMTKGRARTAGGGGARGMEGKRNEPPLVSRRTK